MIERSVEIVPPDVDEDGDGGDEDVYLTVALVDRSGVHRAVSTTLGGSVGDALIADELIVALRAVASMAGGSLPVEIARRLA